MPARLIGGVAVVVFLSTVYAVFFAPRMQDLLVFNGATWSQHVVLAGDDFDAPPGLSKRRIGSSKRTVLQVNGVPSEIFTDIGWLESRTHVLDSSTDVGFVLVDFSSLYTTQGRAPKGAHDALSGIMVVQASPSGSMAHSFARSLIDSGPGEALPPTVSVRKNSEATVLKLFRVNPELAAEPALLVSQIRLALSEGRSLTSLEKLRNDEDVALPSTVAVRDAVSPPQSLTIRFQTQPPEAEIVVDGVVQGRTPATLEVLQGARLVLRKAGFVSTARGDVVARGDDDRSFESSRCQRSARRGRRGTNALQPRHRRSGSARRDVGGEQLSACVPEGGSEPRHATRAGRDVGGLRAAPGGEQACRRSSDRQRRGDG
jgi:hypothetical protein